MSKRQDRVQTLHPDPTKSMPAVDRWKYEAVRKAILAAVPRSGEGLAFKALSGRVREHLAADSLEKLPASSRPLGMLDSADYREVAIELRPGEVILAYSDGLTEASNAHGEEFGMERLEALLPDLLGLPPAEAGGRVLAAVDRFLGESRLADDLSLAIIIKRSGAALPAIEGSKGRSAPPES